MAVEAEQPVEIDTTPDGAAAFAKKAKDLEALRSAVIDAAGVGAGLWLSYLFVLFYLAIAVGSVTHRNLLFESPVKLPFLNVDLPLIGFFVLGPAIFLIVHAYVLLHFVLLADKVGAFHAELLAQIADEDARTRLRRQLPSNIFVQFLAGPREVRTGLMGFLLRLIAQISLVAGPLALLVFFQLQFLPYHHEAIAWWQRVLVVLDLALLWTLWPSVVRGETMRLGWHDFRRGKVLAWGLASLVPVLLVFTIATFPGEWLDATLPPMRFVPTKIPASPVMSARWTLLSLHELLVGGEPDFVAGKPSSLWSYRLVLPGINVAANAKSEVGGGKAAPAETLTLRGRRLEGAVLIDAHLRDVDFTAAQLRDADFSRADLQEAKFECESKQEEKRCAQLQGVSLKNAVLQGANLNGAYLQDATLDYANLQGATLNGAHLEGAKLDSANLEGASLSGVQLQSASLEGARLQGVSLDNAQLQGATLNNAQLQGARLDGANLRAATLERADLQGASLSLAQLQGASLDGARLQGASFDGAQAQGVSFERAQLQGAALQFVYLESASFDCAQLQGATLSSMRGATLDHICAWRTPVPLVDASARVVEPETGAKDRGFGCSVGSHLQRCQTPCEWSADAFADLQRIISKWVPGGDAQRRVLERIATLDPAKPLDEEEVMAKAWCDLARSPPAPDVHEESLSGTLEQIGCNAADAPYVIRGLLRNLSARFGRRSSRPSGLADKFLDAAHCPGAHGLSEKDKFALKKIQDSHASAPPGPGPK